MVTSGGRAGQGSAKLRWGHPGRGFPPKRGSPCGGSLVLGMTPGRGPTGGHPGVGLSPGWGNPEVCRGPFGWGLGPQWGTPGTRGRGPDPLGPAPGAWFDENWGRQGNSFVIRIRLRQLKGDDVILRS